MSMALARAAAVMLALVLCAWFAVGIRQAHETGAAARIVNSSGPVTAADAAHARSLLSAAAILNPDAQVDLLRGTLALRQGNLADGARIATDVIRSEPMNVQAWLLLAEASPHKPQVVDAAVGRMAQLDPILLRSRR